MFVAVRPSCPSDVIEAIRQVYRKSEGVIFPIPWCDEFNFQIEDIFTRLRIVEKDRRYRITTAKEVTNMTSIFTPHRFCKQPLIVLIEGEPGMGKTTYCQKLVFDWAGKQCREWDESFPRIDVLLLLRCRGIKSTLWDAIEEQILPEEIKPEEKKMFFQFLKENPSKVLLLLDGLDEADPQKLEMYLKLVQRRQLPGCHIVLTSRHEVGSKVRPYADTLLEIVGFTATDAECYIRKYFQHAEHLAEELISKVKLDEDLGKLTQNPLNALLLCVIFEDLQGILPTNRTQLYVEIVLFILRRYESKNGLSNRGKDLLLVYKKELMILGETALDSLRKQELYFDDHKGDIKESSLIKFGFLSIQSGGSKRAPCDRYGFFHKSFQEFFSGYFLAFSIIEDFTNFHSVLTDSRYIDELVHVFRFMSGIVTQQSEETAVSIVQSIASIVNETGRTSHKYGSYLKVLHHLINECKTCSGDVNTKLACAFGESLELVDVVVSYPPISLGKEFIGTFLQALTFNSTVTNLKLLRMILETRVVNPVDEIFNPFSLSSSLFLMKCIGAEEANSLAQVLRVNTSLSSLDLDDNSIGDKGANSLAHALGVNTCLSLNLSSNSIGADGACSLAQALMVNTSLSSLGLHSNSIGADGANSFAHALRLNTSLSSLNLSSNSISVEGASSLAQALRINTSLSSLDLAWNGIGGEGANSLAQALRINTSLSSLDLTWNGIGNEGANSLAQALRVNTSLSSLDLGRNSIGAEGGISLAHALGINTCLSSLNLEGNSIGAEGANSLAQALRVNTSLSSLDLGSNSIGAEGGISLAHALGVNTCLSSLNLSRNSIGAEGANSLAQALRVNASLSSLDLDSNSIGAEGGISLAHALGVNTCLSSLNLEGNSIGAEGANSLAQALRVNASLSSLDLGSNSIGAEGGISLAHALRVNTCLSSLDLGSNSIGAEGGSSLAHALRVSTSLSSLKLSSNSIGAVGVNALAQVLRVNTSLSSLDLGCNSSGDEGANSLAQALTVNTSLSSLDLHSNSIGTYGANSLAHTLRVNTSLSSLGLRSNSISVEGANSLAQALRVNTSLSFLDLGFNSFGAEGESIFDQALRVNTSLSSLDLSYIPTKETPFSSLLSRLAFTF